MLSFGNQQGTLQLKVVAALVGDRYSSKISFIMCYAVEWDSVPRIA
jgi:hypothetical protein